MTFINNPEYNEGWADAVKYINEDYLSTKDLIEYFDNFLDKILKQQKLLEYVLKHYKSKLDMFNVPMVSDAENKKNLDYLLKSIEDELKTSIKRKSK